MKVVAVLTDADGKTRHRVENLRWFLNLISAYIKHGKRIIVILPEIGGTIEVNKQTTLPPSMKKASSAVSRAINESDRKREQEAS